MIKLKLILFFRICFLVINGKGYGQAGKEISTSQIAKLVLEKNLQYTEFDFYDGTLVLHCISEFALLKGNDTLLKREVGMHKKFGNGEIKAKYNFCPANRY